MTRRWLQIRGYPSIRKFLFSQSRVENEFDDHLEEVTSTTTVFRLCGLVVLLLNSPMSTALEVNELSVSETDGDYNIRIVSVLNAPAHYVYNVITDYKHTYRINPTVIEAEILPSEQDEVTRVRNLSEHHVGPFSFDIRWLGEIVEANLGEIKVTTIPEAGSFKSGFALWVVQPLGGRTRVSYESSMEPDFFIPPIVGDKIMLDHMGKNAISTFKRIECHAMIKLEMDMEHEPDLLKALLSQGKDCISSQVVNNTMSYSSQ